MSDNHKSSTGRMVVLGALLLLAATASGCGVGLPTQPDVDGGTTQGRSASTTRMSADAPFEVGDGLLDGTTGEDAVAGEIRVPTPTGTRTGGWAKGHYKDNWKHNHN